MTPFGLSWGMTRADVAAALSPVMAVADEEAELAYPLASIAERVALMGGFCPPALLAGPERNGDEVTFGFAGDALVSAAARFGYAFESIGLRSETLSDLAMSAFSRAEFQKLMQALVARHGAPIHVSESPARAANRHLVGTALFCSEDGTVLRANLGHDSGAIVGALVYVPPATPGPGF